MDRALPRGSSDRPYLWHLGQQAAALHSGDRHSGSVGPHPWPGDRSAHRRAALFRGDNLRRANHRRERHREGAGMGTWLGAPLALLALTRTCRTIRRLLATARRALLGLARRSVGRQAARPMEGRPGAAAIDGRRLAAAHPLQSSCCNLEYKAPSGKAPSSICWCSPLEGSSPSS